MKLTNILAPDFDLEKTLNSGQVFHWEKIEMPPPHSGVPGNGFVGAIDDRPAYVEQRGEILRVKVASASSRCLAGHAQDTHSTIAHYFALDHSLPEICASFPSDPTINAARDFCRGLRIIRQPKWECLATFICSSMKQIAHIRQISKALRIHFGEARQIDNHAVHIFPSAHRIAETSEQKLLKCSIGYRAKSLWATARLVAKGAVDLDRLQTLSDADLREALCQLPGVGPKVANCVMLFGYERLRAFPIDVWIERVIRERYFPRARRLNAARIRTFTEEYFGRHGGYAQQYLFHHARMIKSRSNRNRLLKMDEAGRSDRNDKKAVVR